MRDLINTQLSLLGVSYIDLYMLHSPLDGRVQPQTWKALEELYNEGMHIVCQFGQCLTVAGVLKSIGVSNFDSRELQQLLSSATVKPMLVQNKVDIYHYGKQLDNQGNCIVGDRVYVLICV